MKNEVYYNMDKNDAEGMAEKETMEAAKKRVESLERVKDIVDKFDDGDIVAQSLLEPETYEQVYKPTVETLSQGNAAVKKSSRDSALILSKMAENFHKNYGVPLQIARIVSARTAPGDAAQVYGEMFDVSRGKNPATSLKDFYDRIKDRKKESKTSRKQNQIHRQIRRNLCRRTSSSFNEGPPRNNAGRPERYRRPHQ